MPRFSFTSFVGASIRLRLLALLFALAAAWPATGQAGEATGVDASPTSVVAAADAAELEKVSGEEAPVAHADRGSDAPASGHLRRPDVPKDFTSHDTGWMTIAYHPSLEARVRVLMEEAEEERQKLVKLLGRPVLEDVLVLVGRTAGEMETLAPAGSGFPKYASGVAYSAQGLVLLTATSRYPGERLDLPEVFRHELAHIALHDAVGRENVPRWFNEGFAIHASREAQTARIQALWTAAISENLLPFSKLTRSFPADATSASVAYAQAADLLRFLLRTGEEHRFSALIERMARGQSFDSALSDAYSTDMFLLEKEWREDVARRYTFWPVIFGGSLIWVFALGLLVWGYYRRRARAKVKLHRWAREEAIEDARRELNRVLRPALGNLRLMVRREDGQGSGDESKERVDGPIVPPAGQAMLPTVEHEGERHTLH